MWQEARKQEKHIKTLMVDYKKRAERRREYYERIKQDPIKFLRVYGRPSKLHVDSEVVKAAENPNNMMPWIGDSGILIDRFDVRANLEHLDNEVPEEPKLTAVERIENRLCMYERYRCLIHNDFAGVTETMALKQIELDEKYGDLDKKRKEEEEFSKKSQEPKAAIGFTYEDSQPPFTMSSAVPSTILPEDSDSEGDEADSDMDIDVELDLATLGLEGRRLLAASAANYGLHPTDFVRLLNADQQLETELRLAKALEEEKLQLAGRKSRRARRLLKERRVKEKLPKLITTKVGLLNGQPISRRTVYLSASSSDSGDYPSDENEEQVDRGHLRGSKPTADVRARRARAKPLLTNARGPAVMIGGMTSIGLCRRHHNHGLDASEKMRKAGARSSSSSRDTSTSNSRHSSSSSDRSRSGRRYRRNSGVDRRQRKRSRVEYITTFGDNNDDDTTASRFKNLKSAPTLETSAAVSAVAASAVSRMLSTHSRSPTSHKRSFSGISRSHSHGHGGGSTGDRSPLTDNSDRHRRYSGRHRSGSHSSDNRAWAHGHTSSSSGSSRSRDRSTTVHTRNSPPNRWVSPRKSASRSPLSQRLANTGSSFGSGNKSNSPGSPSSRLYETGGANPPRREDPPSTPTVRKRYYRPELESDEQSSLSDTDEDGDRQDRVAGRRNREQSFSRRSDAGSVGSSAGKMMTSQSTPIATATKSALGPLGPGGGIRLTPQELLKRRVQSQLTKAFIADKKAEQEKQIQLEKERQAREEGLRRQARLLRRQEEKRLREERRAAALAAGNLSGDSSDSSSSSSSGSKGPESKSSTTISSQKGSRDMKNSVHAGKFSRFPLSPSSTDSHKKESAGTHSKGSVPSQRGRLSSNLASGYHSRDYDYPSPDRRSIRERYGSSPDRYESRSYRDFQPRYHGRSGDRPWQPSRGRERPPMHRDIPWSSRRMPPVDRSYPRYGDRDRYS